MYHTLILGMTMNVFDIVPEMRINGMISAMGYFFTIVSRIRMFLLTRVDHNFHEIENMLQ